MGRVALKYPELRSVVVGEGLIAPVSAEGKAAVAAAQKDNEKLRQAVEAGDLRSAAILQYDNALGEPGAFEKLSTERQHQLLYNAKTIGHEPRRGSELTCEQLGTLSVPILLIRGEETGAPQRYRYEMTISCLPNRRGRNHFQAPLTVGRWAILRTARKRFWPLSPSTKARLTSRKRYR